MLSIVFLVLATTSGVVLMYASNCVTRSDCILPHAASMCVSSSALAPSVSSAALYASNDSIVALVCCSTSESGKNAASREPVMLSIASCV